MRQVGPAEVARTVRASVAECGGRSPGNALRYIASCPAFSNRMLGPGKEEENGTRLMVRPEE
jgi:hypothetical protein